MPDRPPRGRPGMTFGSALGGAVGAGRAPVTAREWHRAYAACRAPCLRNEPAAPTPHHSSIIGPKGATPCGRVRFPVLHARVQSKDGTSTDRPKPGELRPASPRGGSGGPQGRGPRPRAWRSDPPSRPRPRASAGPQDAERSEREGGAQRPPRPDRDRDSVTKPQHDRPARPGHGTRRRRTRMLPG